MAAALVAVSSYAWLSRDDVPCVREDGGGRCVERLALTTGGPLRPNDPDTWQYVGTASTASARECGVHCSPLASGQALEFVFDRPFMGSWSMAGVDYPLWLFAVDGGPSHGVLMLPGQSGYVLRGATRYVEVRP